MCRRSALARLRRFLRKRRGQCGGRGRLRRGGMAGGGAWRPPRSCEDYWAEWKHCRGLRHAFHHYYAHGELPSCGQWRADYGTCRAWERGAGAAAQVPAPPREPGARGGRSPRSPRRQRNTEALCKSERSRVLEKQKYAPVWKRRESPPPDWYLPLDQDKPK